MPAAPPRLVLADGLSAPDDLLFDAGLILVGEHGSGRIAVVGGPDGIARLPGTVALAEGIALVGGVLYVADQANDRIVILKDGQTSTFLQLAPVRGIDGVDGISAGGGLLVIGDSARGAVLWVAPDGSIRARVGGFARPAGTWALADGSALVADENSASVLRVAQDGSKQVLARGLPLADDVVQDSAGRVFAITITPSRLVEIGVGGTVTDVATGFGQLQGLGLDGAGNLLVTDFDRGQLVAFVEDFKLSAPRPLTLRPDGSLCLPIVKGPRYTSSTAAPGTGYAVMAADQVRPQVCNQAQCRVQVSVVGGGGTDSAWITYRGS